jgi:hypothetical protein
MALARLLLRLKAQRLDLLLDLAEPADGLAFLRPAGPQRGDLLGQRGHFALHVIAALDAVGIGFALQGCALNLQRRSGSLQLSISVGTEPF